MGLLLLYWGILIGFYLIAMRLRDYKEKFGFVEGMLNVVIYVLVFVMGLRMGANEEVTSNLAVIGLESVGISVFAIAGSMMAVSFVRRCLGMDKKGVHKSLVEGGIIRMSDGGEDESRDSGMKTSLIILLCVVLGMISGYILIPKIFEDTEVFQNISGDFMVISICILLGIVGFDMGLDGSVIDGLKAVGLKALLIPVAAIAGSVIFGAIYGLVSDLSVREAMAVSSGFGWYTLAPSIIAEAGFAIAGAVSFMHNVIRETLGIIIIPLAAKKFGYLEATSIPGVAAMDVCLPIVERSCGNGVVIYSFCTGAIMSAVVPVLVPLIIG